MSEPIIRYENVSICQQGLEILEGINFELNKGEFVYLIGKVGSGKTSFLKTTYGELAHRRLRSWGLNTIANSSDKDICLMSKR
jgi:ABC-type Mn2+/Zn2+ transport system ATPase subunit